MELRQLVYAEAVARHRHFTRAAEELHVAQSALSHQIRRLEAELGTELFERTSRRVIPTAAGEAVALRARRVIAEADAIRGELDELRGLVRGRITIGALLPAGELEVTTVLASFNQAFPGIEVGLREGTAGDMLELLEADRIDVSFSMITGDLPDGIDGLAARATKEMSLPSRRGRRRASAAVVDSSPPPATPRARERRSVPVGGRSPTLRRAIARSDAEPPVDPPAAPRAAAAGYRSGGGMPPLAGGGRAEFRLYLAAGTSSPLGRDDPRSPGPCDVAAAADASDVHAPTAATIRLATRARQPDKASAGSPVRVCDGHRSLGAKVRDTCSVTDLGIRRPPDLGRRLRRAGDVGRDGSYKTMSGGSRTLARRAACATARWQCQYSARSDDDR